MGSSSSKNNNTRREDTHTRREINNNRREYNNNSRLLEEEYYRQIAAHELYDTLKKSKKQKQSFLKKYHIVKLEELDIFLNDECPICLEKLLIGDKVYLLPCSHYFHHDCIKDWVFRDNVCPSCRDTIGKHSQNEIDTAIFNRDIKNKRIKYEYYKTLSIQQLKKIVLVSNIKFNLNDTKQIIINKLVDIDEFINLKFDIEYTDESDESNTEYFDQTSSFDNDISISSDQTSSFDYDISISSDNLRIINRNNIILDDDI